ncbi:MAG: outer membrane protein OmpA-like peptidoglycan-associated protein, partial [Vicingaceae bacterium]
KYNSETIDGLFEYNGVAQENITLIVYDENGFPIDTFITDAEGKFSYDNLDSDEEFSIRPLMDIEDTSIDNVEIFATDKNGKKLTNLIVNKNQDLDSKQVVVSNNDKDFSVLINDVIVKKETVFAQVYFEQMPIEEVDLLIIDEDGNLIEKRTTDKDGKFSYIKLENQKYNIRIVGGDSAQQATTKIYLVDDSGLKIKRLNVDSNGVYKEDFSKYNAKIIEGLFEYNGVAQENITLIVYDENGFPIDTFITDAKGTFSYANLSTDEIFSIRPLMDLEDTSIDNVEIFATDQNGKKISNLILNRNQLAEDNGLNKKSTKETIGTYGKEPSVSSSLQTVYFDFNETVLSDDDKATLDKVINSLKSHPNSTVTMIGFTDNIGSVDVNVRVASARARATRAYLTENGISKKRVTIYGYGEVMFKGDNATAQGRALNRRVEIEIKL